MYAIAIREVFIGKVEEYFGGQFSSAEAQRPASGEPAQADEGAGHA